MGEREQPPRLIGGMNLSQFNLLRQQQNRGIQENEEQAERWKKFKEEYETLQSQLKTLPNELSHDVMVPIGSQALMRGKMVHTNEILVLLGDNWFVKCTANHASDICDRRIKHCNAMLESLKKESELLSSWQRETEAFQREIMGNGETVEINEAYDEEKEEEWRVTHRQKVREYHQKLAEIRNRERKPIETEEDLFKRMDDLEIQEELEDELAKIDADEEYSGSEEESDNNDDMVRESTSDNVLPENVLHNSKERSIDSMSQDSVEVTMRLRDGAWSNVSSESELNSQRTENVVELCIGETDRPQSSNGKASGDGRTKRRVSFASSPESDDNSDPAEPLHIIFRHSSATSRDASVDDTDDEAATVPLLNSPADIYTHFSELFAPKSILKVKSNPTENSDHVPVLEPGLSGVSWVVEPASMPLTTHWDEERLQGLQEQNEENPVPVVFGDTIIEHNLNEEQILPEAPSLKRPTSRFRAARQAAKR